MIHYLDVRNINGAEIAPVDVITFGSPCQDLSVAGKRAGLKHEDIGDDETTRSGLFMEAVRIIIEMRIATNGVYPAFAVWENVPGAFSSAKGEDFRTVLEELCKIADETVSIPRPQGGKWLNAGCIVGDGFSVAWRVVDAQYRGVPQRRRRIFLVVDFAGQRAGEILFDESRLSENPPQSGIPWQTTAGSLAAGSGSTVSILNDQGGSCMDVAVAIENHPTDGRCRIEPDGKVQTLTTRMGTSGMNVPLVMNESIKCFGICSDKSNSMLSDNPHSGIYEAETARTLDGNGGNPGCNQGGIAVVCVDQGGGKSSCAVSEKVAPTLACTHGGEPAVCIQGSMIGRKDDNGPQGSGINEDVAFTLNATDRHAVYAMTTSSFTQVTKEKSPTLVSRDYKDAPIVSHPAYGIDRAAYNQGQNALYKPAIEEEQQPTLTAKGPGAVAQPASFYPQMKAESQCCRQDGKANTLVNGTCPGFQNGLIEPDYIVRRLTPTECARLQGFPDWWSELPQISEMSDEDYIFWDECLKINADINGKKYRKKSREQMIKWYNNLHTDSAEYKMWGNGLALPCALFVLRGIAECGAKTLGSLFDGSGGFPLAGMLNGIMPQWASEIEPYPVAVTKERFKG